MANPTTPIVQDLTGQNLSAKVDTSQAKDADGYYYKAGDLVEISANRTVKKLSTTGRVFGQLKTSIHENQAPNGLDADHRVVVLTKYRQLTKMDCTGTVAAGDDVVASTATANKVMAATALDVTVDSGATAVTSSAANGPITTVTGSTLPESILGPCWIGGTDTEIQVLS